MEIPAKLVEGIARPHQRGFNDCARHLVEAAGDIEKADRVLRKKGQAAAAKKATREASEGLEAATFTQAEDRRTRGNQLRIRFRRAARKRSSS